MHISMNVFSILIVHLHETLKEIICIMMPWRGTAWLQLITVSWEWYLLSWVHHVWLFAMTGPPKQPITMITTSWILKWISFSCELVNQLSDLYHFFFSFIYLQFVLFWRKRCWQYLMRVAHPWYCRHIAFSTSIKYGDRGWGGNYNLKEHHQFNSL